MGYTTEFCGQLEFVGDVSVELLRAIKEYFGKDMRELDPAYAKTHGVNYIDLTLTDDLDGIKWDGSEKSYGMVEAVNWLIAKIRKDWPSFTLKGEMAAQGEDVDDRWILRIVNGKAVKIDNPPKGKKVKCPECEHEFRVE